MYQTRWVQFQPGAETLCSPWPFCVILSPSVDCHSRLFLAALPITFSPSNFVSGDLALTGALGIGPAGALTRPHVRVWQMGNDYSNCIAS